MWIITNRIPNIYNGGVTTKLPKLPDEGLGRFARAFKSEADLWDKLAELFRRMGRERVRITHGPQEHGRDIVFYGPGGLRTALYACCRKKRIESPAKRAIPSPSAP